ncbi:MAG TPA: carbohydrate-binding family 9-like protein [Bryobacteraceae bacterium]|nr:carbohydrate-binding family 9-like protein [Bryobacteraceae bacterium]
MKRVSQCWLFAAVTILAADGPGVIESRRASAEFDLTANPDAPQWKGVAGVTAAGNYLNEPIPGPPTEFRSRWTDQTLYLLFICPYDELNLKPDPNPAAETPQLWNWDVGEAFIGTDFNHIGHYKELQVSPQSEWVDLDINLDDRKAEVGMAWNSGYKVKGRIDRERHVWYGEMAIPMAALGVTRAAAGTEMRVGLYRIAGTGGNKKFYAWQPTGQKSFHVPKLFGRLRLVD